LATQALNVPVHGSVKIPSRVSPISLVGAWVSEGSPKPVFTIQLTSTTLSPSKLVAITAWSEEIANYSTPMIENLIADALRHDLNALLDVAAFGSAAGSATTPAGLFNGVSPITATVGGGQAAAVGDVSKLLAAISPASSPVLVGNSATLARLSMWAPALMIPAIVSEALAANSLAAIDAGDVVTMMGDITFLASTDASLHMSDAPLAIGTAGSPNTVAAPVYSAFQMNLIALRSVLYASWARRRATATAIINSVTW
jgi:hypothetical protein